jgi:2-polyprenyl-6-methoxyphenol hydroxylase-like FAD-dependent oxidoreductase
VLLLVCLLLCSEFLVKNVYNLRCGKIVSKDLAIFLTSPAMADAHPLSVCVIGGSIGGLAAALSFHRLGACVRVLEKAAAPLHGRGGSIGFVNNQLWEKLRGAPMMRRGQRASRAQGAYLYGDLWAFLYDGLPAGTVTFGAAVDSVGDDPTAPSVLGEACDVCVIADGGWSALRERYFAPHLRLPTPIYAGYNVWRFRVERKHVPGWESEGEYSDGGHHRTILMHIALDDGRDFLMGGTAIAAPEGTLAPPDAGASRQVFGDDEGGGKAKGTPAWYLPWFKQHFGRHAGGELYRAHAAAAVHGKISAQPQYEFAASRVVLGRLVLVGDAAHMCVPSPTRKEPKLPRATCCPFVCLPGAFLRAAEVRRTFSRRLNSHTHTHTRASLNSHARTHTRASPRTAAGAHTAVLDGLALHEAFAAALAGGGGAGPLAERLLKLYEPPALERAAALYARSREVSADVTAPGWQRSSEL